MLGDTNWTDAGAAAAVGNTKRLVEVEMTDISANVAGTAEADLRVHVRAIHVNLSAVGVNYFADLADRGLEYAMSGWIGDHERGEIVFVRVGLGSEICQIDIAILEARDRHDFEAGHDG